MPPTAEEKAVSLALSVFVMLIAGLLSFRQWRERRLRDSELSAEDARYFRGQDRRRAVGALEMVLLAAGLSVGTRLHPLVAERANPWFVVVWMGVFVLIFILLVLAFNDLMATRSYAKRHRDAIVRERLEMLREEARRRADHGGGRERLPYPKNGFPH